jgi:regulator of replication initiation timing
MSEELVKIKTDHDRLVVENKLLRVENERLKTVYGFIEYKLRTGVYSYSNKILDQAKEMLNETK